jgi:hypothetical protein
MIQWVMGLFPGGGGGALKRALDHLPPSRADVKSERTYNSAPPKCLHGTDIVNFYLLLKFTGIYRCYKTVKPKAENT